jgi:hypothetical protein
MVPVAPIITGIIIIIIIITIYQYSTNMYLFIAGLLIDAVVTQITVL